MIGVTMFAVGFLCGAVAVLARVFVVKNRKAKDVAAVVDSRRLWTSSRSLP